MQAAKTRLGFLKLSAELRNQIYELLLLSKEPLRILGKRQPPRALFSVSKQVRQEALSIFYGGNRFYYLMSTHCNQMVFSSLSEPKAWIIGLGPEKARLVRSLTLSVRPSKYLKPKSPRDVAKELVELFASKYNLPMLGGVSISDTLLEILAGNGLSKKAVKVVYKHRRRGQTDVDLLDPAVVA